MEARALNYLSLARKAGKAELGEEPVGDMARTGKAYLIMVAADASDHTWRRAKAYAAGTEQQCVRLPFPKEELGMAVGRTSLAIAALTDAAMALALLKSLPNPEAYMAAIGNPSGFADAQPPPLPGEARALCAGACTTLPATPGLACSTVTGRVRKVPYPYRFRRVI